ncbi:hypothetical protein BJ170DRAFT_451566 [Xylariales sp. AK1849]|nr:hypothetical protein BJ170DRAFT_451566 [Xylariales sp. AK1849]
MVDFSCPVTHRSRTSRLHHDPHARRSTRSELPERRIEITLVDLDDIRDTIKVGIKRTSQFSHVAGFLKRRYSNDEERIPEEAQISFYWVDKRLIGNEIPSGISSLRYRIDDGDSDGDRSIQISRSSRVRLEPSQSHHIHRDIEFGKTIGALRRSVASYKNIDDTNRVVISAQGGLRPGPIQGNHWEARRLKSWLCRTVLIDIVPPNRYVVLQGVNEGYIYHPPPRCIGHSVDFVTLRNWLQGKIIKNVHHRSSSRLKLDADDITLTYKGRVPKRIVFGQIVEFELTRDVADKFIEEEAWLVPLTESCLVCGDEKRLSEMPRRITRSCDHDPNTCKVCVAQWIVSSLDTVTWDRLKCPECPQLLQFQDVKAFASRELFDRYDNLAMKAVVADMRDFKWCLNPACGSGQIHRAPCPKVKCHACRASLCTHHNLPWHRGETCEQYDRRTRRQRKSVEASEKKVKEITKSCPQCRRDVEKYSGCDHITCVCGHEWCYICLATYYRDRNSFLQCRHKRDCKYLQNPPNYEGGRAFMPFLNQANINRRGAFPPPLAPRFQDWAHHPLPRAGVPQRRGPAAAPVAVPGPPPPPAAPPAEADPFRFLLQDFLRPGNHGNFDNANHVRHEQANDFLETAALFTMEQLMQRAR